MKKFKQFLLKEANNNLSEKTGDILEALQDLQEDMENLGTRSIIRICKQIVAQIRKILHDDWPDSETGSLQILQKIGVALMKGIDSNDDLKEIVSSSIQELQGSSEKDGQKLNDLGNED